jgi:hypothetical protein
MPNSIIISLDSGKIELEENNPFKIYMLGSGGNYGSNLVLNGDGDNTTDFINPTDGLAENWYCSNETSPSIITGTNGFSNNAQRGLAKFNPGLAVFWSNDFGITEPNKTFHFWMQYRSNVSINIAALIEPTGSGGFIFNYTSNTGNAKFVEGEFTNALDPLRGIGIYASGVGPPWVEFDKIMVKEVL